MYNTKFVVRQQAIIYVKGGSKMKSLRDLLPLALLAFCAVAFAQSALQKSFDVLKTLAGCREGRMVSRVGAEVSRFNLARCSREVVD